MCGCGVWDGQHFGASSLQHTLAGTRHNKAPTKNGTFSEVLFFLVRYNQTGFLDP